MDDDAFEPSDVVRFEIPATVELDELYARIRPRWRGWTTSEDDVSLVAAEAGPGAAGLAELLREVEAYVADAELQPIRYWLDGRPHLMVAAVRERAA